MSRPNPIRMVCWLSFVACLAMAAPVLAQAPGQGVGELPAEAAARAREMTAAGVPVEEARQLAGAMIANRFEPDGMLRAQAIVVEAHRQGLPVRPVIHKALEGMAKQVPPERILLAMQAVTARYAFAYDRARSLSLPKDQVETMGNLLAESLAAGLEEPDADRLIQRLRESSGKTGAGGKERLAAACLAMLRDMTRLGAGSELSTAVVSEALARGFDVNDIAGMHQSMLAQAQSRPAQEIAQQFAQGLQQGQAPHGAGGAGQSGAGGVGGSGGSGGGAGAPGGPGGGPGAGGGGNR